MGLNNMGFANFGGGDTNVINVNLGNPSGASGAQGSGELPALQIRFDSAKDRLDKNQGDGEALQDLRNLKKDVDAAVRNESSKECGGHQGKQDMLEQMLDMIMQLLQQVMGGDEEEEGGEGGDEQKGKPGSKAPGGNLTITISTQ